MQCPFYAYAGFQVSPLTTSNDWTEDKPMSKAEYRSAGRRFYPHVIFQMIVERVEKGESIETICEDVSMPTRSTTYAAIQADSDLAARYAQAMQSRKAGTGGTT
jgi:hypothetical protein